MSSDSPAPAVDTAAATRRDILGLRIAIWVGVFIGLVHGVFVFKYGLLSMGTVAVIGLMVILSVSIYAAIVALMPARPIGDGPK